LECLEEKINGIEEVEQKKEIIQLFYILRYYNFIVYDEENFVKDVKELEEIIEYLKEKVIRKLYNFKVLNPITKDIQTDIKIIEPILNTRIINLENINILAMNVEDNIKIGIYDGQVLELEFMIENELDIKIKKNKKVRLFTK